MSGPPIPMVDENHTPTEVRAICDWWVENRARWFKDQIDIDDDQTWWDVVEQVLAPGRDRISVVNAQLLCSALCKLAELQS